MHLKVVILSRLSKSNVWPGDLCWDRSSWPAGLNSFPLLSFSLMSFSVHNTVPFSLLWLRLRLDLPRICGNWEYVFLLPHLVHPCPPLCYARTNLGRHPENMSPHAHRLQCVDSIDHQLMCLFMIPLTESGQRSATHWCSRSSGPVLNFTHKRNQKKKALSLSDAVGLLLRAAQYCWVVEGFEALIIQMRALLKTVCHIQFWYMRV